MSAPICFTAGHFTCGQPTPAQLAALSRDGVQTVINLRAPDEPVEYDEAAESARLGLRYVALPIHGADDLDLPDDCWRDRRLAGGRLGDG